MTTNALSHDAALRMCQGWRDASHDEVARAAGKLGLTSEWNDLVVASAAAAATRHNVRKNSIGLTIADYDPEIMAQYDSAVARFDASIESMWSEWIAGVGGTLDRDVQGHAIRKAD